MKFLRRKFYYNHASIFFPLMFLFGIAEANPVRECPPEDTKQYGGCTDSQRESYRLANPNYIQKFKDPFRESPYVCGQHVPYNYSIWKFSEFTKLMKESPLKVSFYNLEKIDGIPFQDGYLASMEYMTTSYKDEYHCYTPEKLVSEKALKVEQVSGVCLKGTLNVRLRSIDDPQFGQQNYVGEQQHKMNDLGVISFISTPLIQEYGSKQPGISYTFSTTIQKRTDIKLSPNSLLEKIFNTKVVSLINNERSSRWDHSHISYLEKSNVLVQLKPLPAWHDSILTGKPVYKVSINAALVLPLNVYPTDIEAEEIWYGMLGVGSPAANRLPYTYLYVKKPDKEKSMVQVLGMKITSASVENCATPSTTPGF